mmetsp:Transcript_612/g.2161  ORF Transcript_612/g.2161 Transcript_612/m.2161 type:complete len:217 (+) Transcript_612:2031-2681(+)
MEQDERPLVIAIAPSFPRGFRSKPRNLRSEQCNKSLLISFAAVTPISSPSAINRDNLFAQSSKPGVRIAQPSLSQQSFNLSSVQFMSGGTLKTSDKSLAFPVVNENGPVASITKQICCFPSQSKSMPLNNLSHKSPVMFPGSMQTSKTSLTSSLYCRLVISGGSMHTSVGSSTSCIRRKRSKQVPFGKACPLEVFLDMKEHRGTTSAESFITAIES